ncbi:MAG: hypothetical protein M0Z30_12815 [Actinomycetota bacterium]|nr:hypothetical protein [Actinomycetota bacterium]
MVDPNGGEGAMLTIKRRTWLQDAVRIYKVLIGEVVIGSIGPLRTKTFPIASGKHTIRLAMPTTGRSSSALIDIELKTGQQCVVQTVRRGGLASFMKLPLAMPEGAAALAEGRPIDSRYYEGPWIHVAVHVTDAVHDG